jgi:SnoaL-like domain
MKNSKYIFLLLLIANIVNSQNNLNKVDKKSLKLESVINKLMDSWHHAAAVADENIFFGLMAPDAVYIGTDPKEKWYRDELKDWSKKYFDRDTAWAFTPLNRSIYFSKDNKTAWFEENLQTRMKICHGSGVLVYENKTWKIKHYVLSAAVPNDMMDDYLKLYDLIGE